MLICAVKASFHWYMHSGKRVRMLYCFGSMKMFCIKRSFFSYGKKNLLFLSCNKAAVQNLYRALLMRLGAQELHYIKQPRKARVQFSWLWRFVPHLECNLISLCLGMKWGCMGCLGVLALFPGWLNRTGPHATPSNEV